MNKIETLLKMFILFFALFGCSDDKDTDGNDNQSGEPYKFRIDISTKKPDIFKVYLYNCVYNIYKNGTTNPVSITGLDDYLTSFASPHVKEFDLPRNFDGLGFTCGITGEDSDSDVAIIKIFVNDKLLLSYEENKKVILFLYKSDNKYLVDINYNVAVFEFDKLD